MNQLTKAGQLDSSWQPYLGDELQQPYMQQLKAFLQAEKSQGKVIYPSGDQIFNAFNTTPFDQVRVVIIGQDPYHGEGQAHGLSFSVPPTQTKLPPSLLNIYKEMETDLGIPIRSSGDLTHWAEQGVLLLNATLTVEQAKAGSHQKQGWEQFTDKVIQQLNDHKQGLIFVLWGSYAQKKGAVIDPSKHVVIRSAHPSPLSAYRGFFGSRPFSQINAHLHQQGLPVIQW